MSYIMKLAIVIGTRPEIIRLSRIINHAQKYFDLILIHTGQNWDKNLKDVFFEQLEIKQPDYYLNVVGTNLGETMGNVIQKSYELFFKIKPDCLLILGDTNSALCAISAKRLKIPIFHMESGNRCFDQNVPEEINRKIVDHISDINLCYTENSRKYLLAEGARKDHVIVTGSPLAEVLDYYATNINDSTILEKFSLNPNKYFVLSMHREENVDNNKRFMKLINSINKIVDKYQMPIIFSTHPRTKNKLIANNIELHPLIYSIEPIGLFDYCKLQKNAFCVLSDSGSLSEECAILNFAAVSIRDSTERPEAVEKGNVILGNLDEINIINSIELAVGFHCQKPLTPVDYQDGNVSSKVLKIIQGYTSVINKVIWFKQDDH